MDFEKISDTTLIQEILPNLDNESLNRLCQTNQRIHNLCKNDDIYLNKVVNE